MTNFTPTGRRNITVQKAIKILYKYGIDVSPESAKLLLDFLYKFAKLSVEQTLSMRSEQKLPDKKTQRYLSSKRIKKQK
ncbi:hypothetical protein OC25_23860 [Pedobacter kyungheensis]|uniref:Uncharacterized protein n=1 Tax=Pedobacter kyungheensis TaxID=1069985 RepID=A0A0C1FGJ7_9SPHI|nr:hypothetical protein OC25_23860 [Pedobacter kyungheensis]